MYNVPTYAFPAQVYCIAGERQIQHDVHFQKLDEDYKINETKNGQIKDFGHETIKPFILQGFCGQFRIQFWEH